MYTQVKLVTLDNAHDLAKDMGFDSLPDMCETLGVEAREFIGYWMDTDLTQETVGQHDGLGTMPKDVELFVIIHNRVSYEMVAAVEDQDGNTWVDSDVLMEATS